MAVRFEHADPAARDLERMIRFLRAAYAEFQVRGKGISRDDSRWLRIGGRETRMALSPTRAEPEHRWTPYQGLPGVNHPGDAVDGAEALRDRLKSAGNREAAVLNAQPNRKRRYIYDPDGNDWAFPHDLSQDPGERNDSKLPDLPNLLGGGWVRRQRGAVRGRGNRNVAN